MAVTGPTFDEIVAASGLTEKQWWIRMRLKFIRRNILWNIGEHGSKQWNQGIPTPEHLVRLLRQANEAIGDDLYG